MSFEIVFALNTQAWNRSQVQKSMMILDTFQNLGSKDVVLSGIYSCYHPFYFHTALAWRLPHTYCFLKSEGRAIDSSAVGTKFKIEKVKYSGGNGIPNTMQSPSRRTGISLGSATSLCVRSSTNCLWYTSIHRPTHTPTTTTIVLLGSRKVWGGLLNHGFSGCSCGWLCSLHCYPPTHILAILSQPVDLGVTAKY